MSPQIHRHPKRVTPLPVSLCAGVLASGSGAHSNTLSVTGNTVHATSTGAGAGTGGGYTRRSTCTCLMHTPTNATPSKKKRPAILRTLAPIPAERITSPSTEQHHVQTSEMSTLILASARLHDAYTQVHLSVHRSVIWTRLLACPPIWGTAGSNSSIES